MDIGVDPSQFYEPYGTAFGLLEARATGRQLVEHQLATGESIDQFYVGKHNRQVQTLLTMLTEWDMAGLERPKVVTSHVSQAEAGTRVCADW